MGMGYVDKGLRTVVSSVSVTTRSVLGVGVVVVSPVGGNNEDVLICWEIFAISTTNVESNRPWSLVTKKPLDYRPWLQKVSCAARASGLQTLYLVDEKCEAICS